MIQKLLEAVDLSPEQSRIYTHLLENGTSSAGRLAAATGLSRPSVYDHLKTLEDVGLARASTKPGVKAFYAESPERIGNLLDNRLKTIEKQKKHFDTILPTLTKMGKGISQAPQMRPFEGADGLRHALTDVLASRDVKTRSFLPIKALTKILSSDFFSHHGAERRTRNITVKAVWSLDKAASNARENASGKSVLRDIRIASDTLHDSAGYWIYGTKTLFLFCGDHPYAFIIDCADYARMMTMQHDVLWETSEPLALRQDDIKSFMRTLGVDA